VAQVRERQQVPLLVWTRQLGVVSWAAKNATARCQNTAAVIARSSSNALV
jgi:hypothetical protein